MTYAEDTKVSVEKSQADIQQLLKRYGASGFMFGWDEDQNGAVIYFRAHGRHVRFWLPLPERREVATTPTGKQRSKAQIDKAVEQAERSRWRALHLVIKAKLEAVETGIVSFEDEFLSHIVMPDRKTVGEHLRPQIADAYEHGQMPALLPDYSGGDGR
jgi:hypothetical protein